MGRIQKYKTEAEQLTARRDRQMRYYWKNAITLRKTALKRYYKRKSNENMH